MKLLTYFVPSAEGHLYDFNNVIFVGIDVLRAGTTICSALKNGAKLIIPVAELYRVAEIAQKIEKSKVIIAGERNSKKVDDFDLGNSPLEFTEDIVRDKIIVFTSTNGAKAFLLGSRYENSYVGALVNVQSIVLEISRLVQECGNESVIIFQCAGNNGTFSLEDSFCAGAIIDGIMEINKKFELNDESKISLELFRTHRNEFHEYLLGSMHSKLLLSLGLKDDIDFAFKMNSYDILPKITKEGIKV